MARRIEEIDSAEIIESNSSESQPPPSKKSALDILLGPEKDQEESESEWEHYLAEKSPSRDTNPLQWWRVNKHHFPKLAKVARQILCVPATSTPSERLFSKAGLATQKHRSTLKPKNVDAILFLNQNMHFLFD